jgi:hypothetical protein
MRAGLGPAGGLVQGAIQEVLGPETYGHAARGIRGPIVVKQFLPECDTEQRVAYIELVCSSTDWARAINGRGNLYNGPGQKLLQEKLQAQIGGRIGVERIRLQVLPPRQLEEIDFNGIEEKGLARLPVPHAIEEGLVSPNSSVANCCANYSIPYVLVRGDQVVGPSPALANALIRLGRALPRGGRVVDPFAGTYLTELVLKSIRPDLRIVALDRVSIDGQANGYDAFREKPQGHVDLLVVDPFYEDLLHYLRTLGRLSFQLALIQSGETSDLAWNRAASRLAARLGRVEPLDECGKHLLVVTRSP